VSKIGGGHKNIDTTENYHPNEQGRYPSNVVGEIPDHQKYFYCPKVSRKERYRDEKDQIAGMKRTTGSNSDTFRNFSAENRTHKDQKKNMEHGLTEVVYTPNEQGRYPSNVVGEVQGYQKYFYCPKVSRRERHRGFEQDPISHPEMVEQMGGHYLADAMVWLPHLGKIYTHGLKHEYEQWCKNTDRDQETATPANVGNNHPTVKPVELMKYLVKLVTPQGAHVIDPFAGSGSTGMACRELGRQFTGIDLDPNYCAIAERRIAATDEDLTETLFE
jgi:hypothetical protein